MKRTWARFEAVMKQGSEGEIATLPLGNPEGEKRGPGAVKRSTKLCSGESQSEKHDEARDPPPPACAGQTNAPLVYPDSPYRLYAPRARAL